MAELSLPGRDGISSGQLSTKLKVSTSTLKRRLDGMVRTGLLRREGTTKGTRYYLTSAGRDALPRLRDAEPTEGAVVAWSPEGRLLLSGLARPLATRRPVTYRRELVDDYTPNETSLLGRETAEALFGEGRMQGRQPAGTYARKVLEPLLIELSWSSSRLEGNRFSLLATEELRVP